MRANTIILLAGAGLLLRGGALFAGEPLLTAPQQTAPVWPRTASSLPPISLAELVARALPRNGELRWDVFQDGKVLWLTEGTDFEQSAYPIRMGLARVRVAGQSAKILKEGWEELAWGVELSTEGNAKLGPTTLDIHPGYEDEVEKEKYICFGKGFQGCDFPASALNTGQLHLSKECQIGSGEASEDGSIVMSATSADGGAGTVVYSRFVGSGGVSNSIEVTTMTPEEYCEKNKGHH